MTVEIVEITVGESIPLSEEEYTEHCDNDDGVCLICGAWTFGGVEPDAHDYKCEACEARGVVGTEEALMLGRIEIV